MLFRLTSFVLFGLLVGSILQADDRVPSGRTPKRYEARWDSLDQRPMPAWFDEAKFGIFIHWGVYSVPSFGSRGQYAEWYWSTMQDKNSETWKFHARVCGKDFPYQDFASQFKAELFDPDQWADILARSGAKYVVLTSKHHEGFCLWPSAEATRTWGRPWNSVDTGPKRDLLGDLGQAVTKRGLRMGIYYSLYEWFNPLYRKDVRAYVDRHMMPQIKDVVTRYKPSVIFADGEWDHPASTWRSEEFLGWLFNDSPVKDEVVINDRWGKETRSVHGGYFTTEYGEVGAGKKLAASRKWEENRGIGASFGFNRHETIDDYLTRTKAIHMLVDIVSKGGNLLLDIGPTGDGRIPVIMQDRLVQIGQWLKINGEAIYGSRPWRVHAEGDVRYTVGNGALYATMLVWPKKELLLTSPKPAGNLEVRLLGLPEPIPARWADGALHIDFAIVTPDRLPCADAWVLKIRGTR